MTASLYSIQKDMQQSNYESFNHSVGEPSQLRVKEKISDNPLTTTLSPERLIDNPQKVLLSESEEKPLYGKSAKGCMKLRGRSACEVAEPPSERCLRSKALKKPLNGSPISEAEKSHLGCSSRTHKKPHDETSLTNTSTKTLDVPVKDVKKLNIDDLLNGPQRKRGPKKRSLGKRDSDMLSPLATEQSGCSSSPIRSLCTANSLANTPKRWKGRTRLTQVAFLGSTLDRNPATDNLFTATLSALGAKQEDPEHTSQSETPELNSPCKKSKAQHRRRSPKAVPETTRPRSARRRVKMEQLHICRTNDCPPAKRRRGKGQKILKGDVKMNVTAQPPQGCRPRYSKEQERITQDETSESSDLSIELSQHEDQLSSLSEEEEELPSFLTQADEKPPSISEGVFVWCKLRTYTFWPALVKSVNRKLKRASILFIENPLIDIKRKGFTVALKTLKPFDCKEASQLMNKAKEKYGATIEWSLELISDYRIRIACSSFTGSFIEYLAHDMSYPVRKKYPQGSSEILTIPSKLVMEEHVIGEQQEEMVKCSKRLLPDRTHAAHNRANNKLVHFIVKERKAEKYLLAIISGQQCSRWLHSFLSRGQKQMVETYLEEDAQLDQVYQYLNELYCTAPATAPCLANMKFTECVRFVLDVLLPEAIIYAIAGVDNVSLRNAEEKYLKGRRISNREKQEIDWMIEQQMKMRSVRQSTAHATAPP